MQDKRLQKKRATPSGFRVFYAKLTGRKMQRVSATADGDMLDTDVPNMGVKGTLTVLLVLHVVVVGAIIIGTNYTKDDALTQESSQSDKASPKEVDTTHLNVALKKDFVLVGETYESFAKRHQVYVAELKAVNNNAQIHAGRYLYVPNRKIEAPVVVNDPPADAQPRESDGHAVASNEADRSAEEPLLIKLPNHPGQTEIPKAIPVAEDGARTYTVKAGDTVWRISNDLKVDQAALLKLNGMDDPRKLRLGMKLKIPN